MIAADCCGTGKDYVEVRTCAFCACAIAFLGHILRSEHSEVAKKTFDAVSDLMFSRNESDALIYLNLCHLFERFVPNFHCLPAPLNKKLKRKDKLSLEE